LDSPATQGEQITIYTTGIGPYDPPSADGTAAAQNCNAVDPVTLNYNSVQVAPDWAGPETGTVGVALIKWTITSDMPTSTNLSLTLGVNCKQSTQFELPLK
ncbi:MAG: hypothetical protein ACRD30_00225, partial [Bryobacteraceae bacterium]